MTGPSSGWVPAADLGEVLPPLVVLVAALVVIVVTVLASRRASAGAVDPVAAARRSPDPVVRWRAEHGEAVDAWLAAYQERFAGLTDVLAGRTAPDVPAPVTREVEDAFEQAAAASPDPELGERLHAMQEAAQSALVATVAARLETAEHEYERYRDTREAALQRLGAVATSEGERA
jgi:hypothetical protein